MRTHTHLRTHCHTHIHTHTHTHAELALEETRADVQSHQERVTVEDEKIGADDLEEAHGTVREDIKGERGELQHIQSQCVADMTTIGSAVCVCVCVCVCVRACVCACVRMCMRIH